eukprot:8929066-Prorocentrum_lima.AAC.1
MVSTEEIASKQDAATRLHPTRAFRQRALERYPSTAAPPRRQLGTAAATSLGHQTARKGVT